MVRFTEHNGSLLCDWIYWVTEKKEVIKLILIHQMIFCTCRLISTYLILPETEGRSLEDIEIHFADNSRKLTDRHITRHSKQKQVN